MTLGSAILLFVALTLADAIAVAVIYLERMRIELEVRSPGRVSLPGGGLSLRHASRIYREYRAAIPGGRLHIQALGVYALGVVGSVIFVGLLRELQLG